jgi:hypothetical protein
MSERGVGSRLSQMSTSYLAEPGGFRIKGSGVAALGGDPETGGTAPRW